MSLKASTGLRTALLGSSALDTLLNLSFVKIYSGTEPLTADAALWDDNVLLCTLSNNGGATGLTFEAAAIDGVLYKNAGETWKGTNAASGLASFYRHVTPTDSGAASTTDVRLQGTVGDEMVLADPNLVAAEEQELEFYAIGLPSL